MSSDFNKFASVLNDFLPSARSLVDSLAHSEGELSKLLCGLMQGFIDIAVEEFPKTVAHLSCAELQFNELNQRT